MKKKILLGSIICLLIDIISKIIIKNTLTLHQSIKVIPHFFNLTYVINDGAAFSILEGRQVFLIMLAVVVLGGIFYYLKNEQLSNYKVLYYSLLIGGIGGNLLDRIIYHGVIDFFDFKILSYDAPIFNLADCFIVVSVFLIFMEVLRKENYETKSRRRKSSD